MTPYQPQRLIRMYRAWKGTDPFSEHRQVERVCHFHVVSNAQHANDCSFSPCLTSRIWARRGNQVDCVAWASQADIAMEVFGLLSQGRRFGDVDIIPRLDMLEHKESAEFRSRHRRFSG